MKKEYVLGLDIGGTNSRIALIEIKKGKPVIAKKETYPTEAVKDIKKLIKKYDKYSKKACIGFAGPVIGNKAKLTNAKLSVNISKLMKETDLDVIYLVNDFHANGYGIMYVKSSDLVVLNQGAVPKKEGVVMATGPGTGLGKVLVFQGKVLPCEPGWTSVGINDIDDYALIDYLRTKYKRNIYFEDILSGRGLIDIYDHLEIKYNLETNMKIMRLIKEEPVNKARIITKYASKDKLSDMTLRIFVKFYARYVRDACLGVLTSKVYLVGGLSNAIRPYLKKYFMEEFLNHEVYRPILKKVRVSLDINEDVGLIGAGAVAAGLK